MHLGENTVRTIAMDGKRNSLARLMGRGRALGLTVFSGVVSYQEPRDSSAARLLSTPETPS